MESKIVLDYEKLATFVEAHKILEQRVVCTIGGVNSPACQSPEGSRSMAGRSEFIVQRMMIETDPPPQFRLFVTVPFLTDCYFYGSVD